MSILSLFYTVVALVGLLLPRFPDIDLGVLFDSHMSLEGHITNVCRSLHFHLRNIGSIRKFLTDDAAAHIVHSLVSSKLDHCNSLLYGLPDSKLQQLQRMQNLAA